MGPIKTLLTEVDDFKKFHRLITGTAGKSEKISDREASFISKRFNDRLENWQIVLRNMNSINESDFRNHSEAWLKLMHCDQKIIFSSEVIPNSLNKTNPFDSSGKILKPVSVSIKFYNMLAELFYQGGIWTNVQQRMYELSHLYSEFVKSLFYDKRIGLNYEETKKFYGKYYQPYHLPLSNKLDCFLFIASECMFYAIGGYSYLDPFPIEDGIDSETYLNGLKYILKAIDAGFGFFVFTEGVVGVYSIPKLKFNERGQIHCADGPAMKLVSGETAYFYNGISVDEKIIMHPQELSVKEILSTKHPHIKEVMIEKYGLGNFVESLRYFVLDEIKVENSFYQLLSVDIEEGDPLNVLRVTCPSTGKKHYLRIPPGIKKFKDALAWTFGVSSRELDIYFET
ncbi:MAG: hypothetical protein N3D80_12655 [Ignavibacterium album]|uniref:DUF6745 domain-containing protein n=1 Tax=Ignavibacterium album TaxID=591197 RepID=UPI0026F202F7|nr:hypothetical protein [Ignavibacterium album]MCX8106710.1 hypothetical protein [Ignavibacterium album]